MFLFMKEVEKGRNLLESDGGEKNLELYEFIYLGGEEKKRFHGATVTTNADKVFYRETFLTFVIWKYGFPGSFRFD